jgi:hypothetical protein
LLNCCCCCCCCPVRDLPQVSEIYSKAASELVSRFREREETVKADIFAAMCELLRQVRVHVCVCVLTQ